MINETGNTEGPGQDILGASVLQSRCWRGIGEHNGLAEFLSKHQFLYKEESGSMQSEHRAGTPEASQQVSVIIQVGEGLA